MQEIPPCFLLRKKLQILFGYHRVLLFPLLEMHASSPYYNETILHLLNIREQKLGRMHETLMIAKHETYIDFYRASERWI